MKKDFEMNHGIKENLTLLYDHANKHNHRAMDGDHIGILWFKGIAFLELRLIFQSIKEASSLKNDALLLSMHAPLMWIILETKLPHGFARVDQNLAFDGGV